MTSTSIQGVEAIVVRTEVDDAVLHAGRSPYQPLDAEAPTLLTSLGI